MNESIMKPILEELNIKLYRQNAINNLDIRTGFGYIPHKFVAWQPPHRRKLTTTYMRVGKFTIVEIVHKGKHYHGVAARAPCDVKNNSLIGGIAPAYNRAFKLLCDDLHNQDRRCD